MSQILHSPRAIQQLMAKHGIAPRKTAGQNFLHDPNVVRRIVAAANLAPKDTVLEIGPGLGSLTLGLAAASRHVVAVEIDQGLVRALSGDILADIPNVTVVHADALTCDFGAYGSDLRMVANLPYNTATPLVFHALSSPSVRDLFVMVQREVALRWQSAVGDPLYSAVSAKLALHANVEIAFAIPRAVFIPVPNVDSVMVTLTRHNTVADPHDVASLSTLIDAAFAQRRKTLANTLGRIATRDVLDFAASEAEIALSSRAEEIDIDGFRRLYGALKRAGVVVVPGPRYGSAP